MRVQSNCCWKTLFQVGRYLHRGRARLNCVSPIDIESAGELRELIGFTMLDHFHIETHPVTTAEELAEFFEQDAAAG